MKKVFLLHTVVVLLLLAVCAWDSVQIINTFVYENRLTVVKTNASNDSAPFLENLTLYATLGNSVLPRSLLRGTNISKIRPSDYYLSAVKTMESSEQFVDSINVSTLEGMVTALYIVSVTEDRDDIGNQCLRSDRDSCKAAIAASQNLSLFRDSQLERIEERLFSELSDYYFRLFRVHSITIHAIVRLYELIIDVCPRAVSKLSTNDVGFAMRLLDVPVANGTQTFVNIFAKESLIQTIDFDAKYQYRIIISVKNVGIYDKSATTPCTREPEIVMSNDVPQEYNGRDYLKLIVRKCGCIPFSDRKYVRELDLYPSISEVKFCDYQDYYDCNITSDEEYLPSCVMVRNEYSTVITQSPCEEVGACPFVDFVVLSSDQTYVLFEDRFQLTFAQFISQLGGNIGLYTGLSLLSVWQLILFIYYQYERYKSQDVVRNDLQYFGGFVRELVNKIGQRRGGENSLETRMEIFSKEQTTMNVKIDRIESKLNDILTVMSNMSGIEGGHMIR